MAHQENLLNRMIDITKQEETPVGCRSCATTNWKQAQLEASQRIQEIESEWVIKDFPGPTREQQARIDTVLAEVARKYRVPEGILRKAVLWQPVGRVEVRRTPLTEADIDELIASVTRGVPRAAPKPPVPVTAPRVKTEEVVFAQSRFIRYTNLDTGEVRIEQA